MAGSVDLTDAVVLRSVDYGDADRIVTLLTAKHGKISALARGARRSKKRFAGALEPCAVVRVEIAASRGDLAKLASAQVERFYPAILASLEKLSAACTGLELVREALPPKLPDPRTFAVVVELFERLGADDGVLEELSLAFTLRILALAGFAVRVDECGRCGAHPGAEQSALFDPKVGGIVCRACGGGPYKLSASARRQMAVATTKAWGTARGWGADPGELASVRSAVDAFAAAQLGKNLAGRDVAAQLREVNR